MSEFTQIWVSVCFLIILICQFVQAWQFFRYRKEMDEIRKQNVTYNWRIEMLEDGYKSLSKQIFDANGKIATRASRNSVDALYKHVGETEKQQTDFNRSFSRAIRRLNRSKK